MLESEAKSNAVPNIQEVVELDLLQSQDYGLKMEQNVSLIEPIGSYIVISEFLGVTYEIVKRILFTDSISDYIGCRDSVVVSVQYMINVVYMFLAGLTNPYL